MKLTFRAQQHLLPCWFCQIICIYTQDDDEKETKKQKKISSPKKMTWWRFSLTGSKIHYIYIHTHTNEFLYKTPCHT